MNGWSYPALRALPADVYDELIAMLNDEADRE
jgi:hypothetical protein